MTEQVRNNNNSIRAKRPYDPSNNKDRGYGKLWALYPDYWPEKWGTKPCLGFVRADSQYDAKYVAYDRGIYHPNNCTFGLDIVEITDRKPKRK